MAVLIRPMTQSEFETFYRWSIAHQIEERMGQQHMSRDEATKETVAEVAEMLPAGLQTANHHLMSIMEADSKEIVGFIWTIHEETIGRRQSFLCDFAIWESMRRKGYGKEALYLMEKNAAEAGCQESVLFVANGNIAAQALYKKCGYRVLRQESYGKYMIKKLQ
jgi:ribosomal protein S18 acetylase RimI-like enzyme